VSLPQFTPGPWALSDEGARQATLRVRQGTEHGVAIATVHQAGAPEQRPNAHLIAAAPDLYEAAQALVDLGWFVGKQVDAVERLERALAKARGEL
jgi:hypothetical protein